jgi:2-polyprenyl-3-methyl-5-hydroxy-6-metoxy-1,4-benzoquinol methylase
MDDIIAANHAGRQSEAGQTVAPIHPHYPDYANPELLDKIPLSARTILDVGCAHGALGTAYMRRNPNARVLGIDSDAESIEHARGRLTEVACVDVERVPMPFAVPEGIDCIIYGDVLEHLVDPWALLARHAEYLAADGTVLVCMPNVEHWSFALRLLNGSFDYEELGLLDRTHLRWFTPRTMATALVNAGLELSDVSPRPIDTESAKRFADALAPGLRAIGVDPQEYFNRAAPLQFIWRARKSAPPRIAVNATMLSPLGGVSDVRVVEPLRALRTDSSVLAAIRAEPEMPMRGNDIPHIAVLHRPLMLGDAGIDRVKTLLAKGYLVVTEFDDHPSFMRDRGVPMDQVLTFKAVHAVQTSTPELADVLRADNPEIAMFPNGIFELPAINNFQDPKQLTVFFGALNRADDWGPMMPALNEIVRAVVQRLTFVVVHDQAFFEALDTPHKRFIPTCDYATYMQLLGAADIAFMPLADTPFNRAKSDLKFIEAGACRVAALASSVVYGDVIEDGKTGLLFRDAMELRSNLLRLLAYPEATRKLGDAARHYVASQRMLAYQVARRSAWYRSLWERRDELTAALRARVPALFE